MLKQTKRTLDTQLRAEYAHYRSDHRHIKYCYECPQSQYITLRGDNKKSLKYNGDKCCLCCLSKDKYYIDIHQPIATATKCPYHAFLDENHTIDKQAPLCPPDWGEEKSPTSLAPNGERVPKGRERGLL